VTTIDEQAADVEDAVVREVSQVGAAGDGEGSLVLPPELIGELGQVLAARARSGEPVRLTGPGGWLTGLMGQVLQAGLAAELDAHLGYGRGDAAGAGSGNSRNGSVTRTVATEAGPLQVAVPRDRAGTFAPALLGKGTRRSDGIDAQVTSLYCKGLSVRDISRHLSTTMGIEMSHDTVSRITDGALEEMRAWQARPLEAIYPVVWIDAMMARVRDGQAVRNKAVNIAIGADCEGVKHVLGIWIAPGEGEGAKAWAQALAQLRNRGVEDVIICCCDGLKGLGEEITTTWPQATVQTCVVHLIRAANRYANYQDRKALCAALRPVYTAADAGAAEHALLELADSAIGQKYPSAVAVFERAWERFIPFLEFEPDIRKVIYTTNQIEQFNRQMRKVIKTRGHFPNDDAVVKLLWLAIVDTEEKRAAERAKEKGRPRSERNAPGHLIEGSVTQGWKQALAAFDKAWPGRIPDYAL
jgi:putative transposase